MTDNIEVNISGAIKKFKDAKIDVAKAVPKLIGRLALMGEHFMKPRQPVRTGTLRRSTHAYPARNPVGIAAGVSYARMANARSSRPHFIEKTVFYLNQRAPIEAKTIIGSALK